MKKGTISIIILCALLFLLVIVGIVAYKLLYVPGNYAFKIENTYREGTNVAYVYDNGKVLLNNGGINKFRYKISPEDVKELLELLPDTQITPDVFVVTKGDGTEINVENRFFDTLSKKIGISNVFEEGVTSK